MIKPLLKKIIIRLATMPPLFDLMNRALNTAPIILTLHRPTQPEFGIHGHDQRTIKEFLAFLRRHRYRMVTVDVIDAWMHDEDDRDMTNTVAFTLDDGYRDQADLIREVFLPMGVPVSMFLITDFIDGKDWPWDAKINWLIWNAPKQPIRVNVNGSELNLNLDGDKEQRWKAARTFRNIAMYAPPQEMRRAIDDLAEAVGISLPAVPPTCHQPVTWDEVRKLESEGIRFGSHSLNHYVFSSLNHEEALRQLQESRQRILAELKYPLLTFCYPVGCRNDYTGRELLVLPDVGYRSAVTMNPGIVEKPSCQTSHEQYAINRYGLPNEFEDFVQFVSWLGRVRYRLFRFSPFNCINAVYGSRRGLVNALITNVNYKLGKYRCYEQVDWSKVKRLIFICKGNVCRSPFAEAAFAQQSGLPVLSYGLVTYSGTMVNSVASRIALQLGVDITKHRSRKLDTEDLRDGDLIIGMEPAHCEQHWYSGINTDVQFTLLGLLNPTNKKPYLHDPYGLSDSYFYRCLSYISSTANSIELSKK